MTKHHKTHHEEPPSEPALSPAPDETPTQDLNIKPAPAAEQQGLTEAMSYPINKDKDPRAAMLYSKWKEQRRVKCAHRQCYYPLNVVRKVENRNQPTEIQTSEGPAYVAECSWDPRHKHPEGGEQYVLLEALKPLDADQ